MGEFIASCPLDEGFRPGSGISLEGRGTFYELYGGSYIYQSAILDSNGNLAGTGHTSTAVLWGARMGEIEWPSLLVMAGDFTLQYPEFFTASPGLHYAFLQMHDPRRYDTNLLFTDGHIGSHELREPPEHLRNSEYHIVRPSYTGRTGRVGGRSGGRGGR